MISLKEIEESYTDYSKEIFTYILRSVHDHDAAEDILQDVFIKLINYSQKDAVHGNNIRALLYSIARSVCIDVARKTAKVKFEQSDVSMLPDKPDIKTHDSTEEMMDAMNSLIDSLGEPEKSLILFKRNGLTFAEIAGIIKISERTLKRKMKSVVAQLRKNLRDEGFFMPDDTVATEESLNE